MDAPLRDINDKWRRKGNGHPEAMSLSAQLSMRAWARAYFYIVSNESPLSCLVVWHQVDKRATLLSYGLRPRGVAVTTCHEFICYKIDNHWLSYPYKIVWLNMPHTFSADYKPPSKEIYHTSIETDYTSTKSPFWDFIYLSLCIWQQMGGEIRSCHIQT